LTGILVAYIAQAVISKCNPPSLDYSSCTCPVPINPPAHLPALSGMRIGSCPTDQSLETAIQELQRCPISSALLEGAYQYDPLLSVRCVSNNVAPFGGVCDFSHHEIQIAETNPQKPLTLLLEISNFVHHIFKPAPILNCSVSREQYGEQYERWEYESVVAAEKTSVQCIKSKYWPPDHRQYQSFTALCGDADPKGLELSLQTQETTGHTANYRKGWDQYCAHRPLGTP
jgi:hypothetical protein